MNYRILLFVLVGLVVSCSSTSKINVNPESCNNSNTYVQTRCCGRVRMIAQQDCKNKYAAYYEKYTECYDAADEWFENCANSKK